MPYLIRQDACTEMFRVDDATLPGGRVIIKRCRGSTHTEAAARLLNEYETVLRLPASSCLTLLGTSGSGYDLVLRYENVPGLLANHLGISDIDSVLHWIDGLAECLGKIHDAGILHRDLRPMNCLIGINEVYIVDFSKALYREREHIDFHQSGADLETLRYAAPEQTGRMNCPVDFRADYYSLGAILYYLLTGQPPFTSRIPHELLYQQLAVKPEPPENLNPRVPPLLSGLVMKLLAKEPDKRYQNIESIRQDLRRVGTMIRGEQFSKFQQAPSDRSHRFYVSPRLYGREAEREILLNAFKEACHGQQEVVVIAGYSGIGKTSLIKETYIPITCQRACFAFGKFDGLQHRTPYSAWIEVLGKLIDSVLSQPEDVLIEWRQRIVAALGHNSGLLTTLIPSLQTLTGVVPVPPELPPVEALNRFMETFRGFIQAFCLPESPLVLFLDDLQWIDSASLQLFRFLAVEPNCPHLLLIVAYRDNEVDIAHPLTQVLTQLRRESASSLREISLTPLSFVHIAELTADTLATDTDKVIPLAEQVAHKTDGNPFFVWQFLRTLRELGWIHYDMQGDTWDWDLESIATIPFADNVVELMLHRFQQLPDETRSLLYQAACLGSRFELNTLSALVERTPVTVYADLLPALREEFILPLGEPEAEVGGLVIRAFRFMHDKMQESAYRSIPGEAISAIHYRIAHLLLAHDRDEILPERVPSLAAHYNAALDQVNDPAEMIEVARLNLGAAVKSRQSAAYASALNYLRSGMARLPADLWDSHPALAYDLYCERGELEYLNGGFEQAEWYIHEALTHEPDTLRRANLHHRLVVQYTLRAQYGKAIAAARQGLALLSIMLPDDHYEAARDSEMAVISEWLEQHTFSDLAALPPMQDARQVTIMQLLTSLGPPCYRTHPALWSVIVAMEVVLCLRHGSVPSASYSFPAYGGLLVHTGQGTGLACAELCEVTLNLMARYSQPADTCVGHLMIGSSLRHWFAPLLVASRDYRNAYEAGLESGNLQYAVYAFGHDAYCRYFQGIPLETLIEESLNHLNFSRKRQNFWGIDLLEGAIRIFCELRGVDAATVSTMLAGKVSQGDLAFLDDAEADYLTRCEQHGNLQVLCIYHILKADAALHQGHWETAGASLLEAESRLDSVSVQGLLPVTQFYALKALVLLEAPAALGVAQSAVATELDAIQQRMARWMVTGSANYSHLHHWLIAERARTQGDTLSAMKHFNEAVQSARQQAFWQRVGLIATRAVVFWEDQGMSDFAEVYRQHRQAAYGKWQANGIIEMTVDNPLDSVCMEMAAVIEVSETLSRHKNLDALVPEILRNVIRQSGAQRAVLSLVQEGTPRVVMESSPEQEIYYDAPVPLDDYDSIPRAALRYVARTLLPLPFSHRTLTENPILHEDAYLLAAEVQSGLCLPLIYLGKLSGLLYLEHRLARDVFYDEQIQLLEFMALQAAISIYNAKLFDELEEEIHARKRAESKAHLAYADLALFSQISAHHLQEPARRLLVYARRLDELIRGRVEDEEALLSLNFIQDGAARLRDLVRDIERYLTATEALGPLVQQDTESLLKQVLKRLASRFEQVGGTIEVLPLPWVYLDQPRLMEILGILLENALIHRGENQHPHIRISGEREGVVARITVEDNGPGIPEEYRTRVFEVFERLYKNPEAGTGIGLSIVRRIVENRFGKINITISALGGTAVVVELPDDHP